MRRMDRYNNQSEITRASRAAKNKDLYDATGSTTKYASFTDVTNVNAIDLSSTKNSRTREGYHQMKEYQDVMPTTRVKKELDEFKHLYQKSENRVYDINNVLEEARKNRIEKDALEEKRKLKNTSYNILASLNPEELEKYRKEKQKKVRHPDDDELRELIDTITSKTLAGDIKAASSLLSDLMATSIMDKVDKSFSDEEDDKTVEESENNQDDDNVDKVAETKENTLSISQEILDLEKLKKLDNSSKAETTIEDEDRIMQEADNEFYTRSMDLSDQDFELDDEFKEKKMPIGIKILIFLIILIVLAAAFYFVWQRYLK